MAREIVFDVNETLLDLTALDPVFAAAFGEASVRREWFAQVLQAAMTATLTGTYVDFGEVGAALTMIGERRGVPIGAATRSAIGDGMRRLPSHQEVPGALDRLRRAGCRLATLTNNPCRRLRRSSATPACETDSSKCSRLMPSAASSPRRSRVEWRRNGSGCRSTRSCRHRGLRRPPRHGALDSLHPRPDIVGPDLTDVAEQIIAVEQG